MWVLLICVGKTIGRQARPGCQPSENEPKCLETTRTHPKCEEREADGEAVGWHGPCTWNAKRHELDTVTETNPSVGCIRMSCVCVCVCVCGSVCVCFLGGLYAGCGFLGLEGAQTSPFFCSQRWVQVIDNHLRLRETAPARLGRVAHSEVFTFRETK